MNPPLRETWPHLQMPFLIIQRSKSPFLSTSQLLDHASSKRAFTLFVSISGNFSFIVPSRLKSKNPFSKRMPNIAHIRWSLSFGKCGYRSLWLGSSVVYPVCIVSNESFLTSNLAPFTLSARARKSFHVILSPMITDSFSHLDCESSAAMKRPTSKL